MSSVESEEVLFHRGGKNSDVSDIWDDSALIDAYDRAVGNAYAKIASRRHRCNSNQTLNSDVSTTVSESSGIHNIDVLMKSGKKSTKTAAANRVKTIKWKVADACRAKYDVDGLTYEAKVTYVNHKNRSCHVTFIGYGNTETVDLSSLEPSDGERAVRTQLHAAMAGSKYYNEVDGGQDVGMEPGTNHSRWPYHQQQYEPDARRFKRLSEESIPCNLSLLKQSGKNLPTNLSSCLPSMPFPPPPPLTIDAPAEEDEALSNMLLSWYMSGYHSGYFQGLKHGKLRESSTNHPHPSSRM